MGSIASVFLRSPAINPISTLIASALGITLCPPENNPPGNIRTVKVTKSKAADNIAAGESAVNDPHATYRVQSADPGDIIKVLEALKP